MNPSGLNLPQLRIPETPSNISKPILISVLPVEKGRRRSIEIYSPSNEITQVAKSKLAPGCKGPSSPIEVYKQRPQTPHAAAGAKNSVAWLNPLFPNIGQGSLQEPFHEHLQGPLGNSGLANMHTERPKTVRPETRKSLFSSAASFPSPVVDNNKPGQSFSHSRFTFSSEPTPQVTLPPRKNTCEWTDPLEND